ncbi:MAG: DNA phosphorothioation-associated protein 4 [Gammaproteobacteria bacterium]|nr:DNA phosphorothioation-associated protein 4 [Gammaproteobacteria bacterium]
MRSRAPNINRSHVHEAMVQRLTTEKPHGKDATLFPTIRELLCFAALLGYSQNRRMPLDRGKGVEDVSYQQFEGVGADDLIFLIAISETKDPEILRDGQEGKCAEIFEEYANGGLQIIHESLQQFGGEYPDRNILSMMVEQGYLAENNEETDPSGIEF